MRQAILFSFASVLVCSGVGGSEAWGQFQLPPETVSPQNATVDSATNVLNEFLTLPNQGIPRSMLERAQGLVIVPGMIKFGFVAGVRRGRGVLVIRDEKGSWRAPAFITLTGGSVGWQVGVQSADIVLVFNTRKSVDNLLRGRFQIGVDATAAAGPVGRQVSAGTDSRLQAEVFSYSRSRGLFVGASVEGAIIEMDNAETQAYYQAAGFLPDGRPATSTAQIPPAVTRLLTVLAPFGAATAEGAAVTTPDAVNRGEINPASPNLIPAQPTAGGALAPPGSPANEVLPTATPGAGIVSPAGDMASGTFPAATLPLTDPPANALRDAASAAEQPRDPVDATRLELSQSARQLGSLLNEKWRQYLSLPKGVFSGEGVPTPESLQQSLSRFDAVAEDSQYGVLTQRPEFQQTYGLLRTYLEQVQQSLEVPIPDPPAGAQLAPANRGSVR